MKFDSDNNQKDKSRPMCFLLLDHEATIHRVSGIVSYYIWNHVSLKIDAGFSVSGQLHNKMDRIGTNV